tara:strand:- start:22 stop:315 length:294 start_codon:yes stop_codon:yes gene_type:complete
MLLNNGLGVDLGEVTASSTSHRGLNCEELADAALTQIIHIGDNVPKPLRDQAIAYQNRVRQVIVNHLRQAVKSDRTTLINELHKSGFNEAAEVIRRL